jgi:riboflavin kinase/FMN adenylyltransferase
MNSYEVHGLRVSPARPCARRWHRPTWRDAARLLGRPYCISGHVVHGRKLGRDLGASAPNRRATAFAP